MTAVARILAVCCWVVFLVSANAQMETNIDTHIPHSASSGYLGHGGISAAIDAKGVFHKGREYAGVPPWINDRIRSPGPEYPYSERLYRHQGVGMIRLKLDMKTGVVTKAIVFKSTGFPGLDQSAVSAFKRWTWKPGRWMEIYLPVTFEMRPAGSPLPKHMVRLPSS